MKHDPEMYRSLARRNYSDRLSMYTRKLSEIKPSIQRVEVKVRIEFRSGVLSHPVVEQKDLTFTPEKVVELVFRCPNNDCTSGCFDITNEVISLIRQKQNGSGEKYCDGREDVKYCGGGSSCDTTLKYEVIID